MPKHTTKTHGTHGADATHGAHAKAGEGAAAGAGKGSDGVVENGGGAQGGAGEAQAGNGGTKEGDDRKGAGSQPDDKKGDGKPDAMETLRAEIAAELKKMLEDTVTPLVTELAGLRAELKGELGKVKTLNEELARPKAQVAQGEVLHSSLDDFDVWVELIIEGFKCVAKHAGQPETIFGDLFERMEALGN